MDNKKYGANRNKNDAYKKKQPRYDRPRQNEENEEASENIVVGRNAVRELLKSGRDIDKISHCGLKYTLENGYPVFEEAIYTLKLEKIYADTLKKDCFIDTDMLKWYKNNDFHTMYVCEIVN